MKSRNWRTGRFELGVSVSEHPYYKIAHGYKYIYVVTGDVIGRGSDGEPVLANVRPLTKPARTLPREWWERYKRDVARRSPLSPREKKWLLEEKVDKYGHVVSVNIGKNWVKISPKKLVRKKLIPIFYFDPEGLVSPYPPKKKFVIFPG